MVVAIGGASFVGLFIEQNGPLLSKAIPQNREYENFIFSFSLGARHSYLGNLFGVLGLVESFNKVINSKTKLIPGNQYTDLNSQNCSVCYWISDITPNHMRSAGMCFSFLFSRVQVYN